MEIIALIHQIRAISLAIEEALQQTPRIAIQDLAIAIEYEGVGDGAPISGEIPINHAHDFSIILATFIEIGKKLNIEFVPPRGASLHPTDALGWLQLIVDNAAAFTRLAADNPQKIRRFTLTGTYSTIVLEIPCVSPVPFYFLKHAPAFGIDVAESPDGVQIAFPLGGNVDSILSYLKKIFHDLLDFAKALPSKTGQKPKTDQTSTPTSSSKISPISSQPSPHLVMLVKTRPFHFTQLFLPLWATLLLIAGIFGGIYYLLTAFDASIPLGSISGIFAVLMVLGIFIDNRKLRITLYCLIPGFIGASGTALITLDTSFLVSHAMHFAFIIYYLRCWYLERELIAWTEILAVMAGLTAYFGILYYFAFDAVFGPTGWGYPYFMPEILYLLAGTCVAAILINAVFNWIKLDRYPAITIASDPRARQSQPPTWKTVWTARPPITL